MSDTFKTKEEQEAFVKATIDRIQRGANREMLWAAMEEFRVDKEPDNFPELIHTISILEPEPEDATKRTTDANNTIHGDTKGNNEDTKKTSTVNG